MYFFFETVTTAAVAASFGTYVKEIVESMLEVACRRESFFLDENRNEMSSRLAEQDIVPAT